MKPLCNFSTFRGLLFDVSIEDAKLQQRQTMLYNMIRTAVQSASHYQLYILIREQCYTNHLNSFHPMVVTHKHIRNYRRWNK